MLTASSSGSTTFGTPGSSSPGDVAAAGVATTAARSDHVHARESLAQTCEQPTANQMILANSDVIVLDQYAPAAGVSTTLGAGSRLFIIQSAQLSEVTDNAVANNQLAKMAAFTVKSNLTSATANAADNPAASFALRDLAINGNWQRWLEKGPSPAAFLGSTNDKYFADQWAGNNVTIGAAPAANWQPARASTTTHFGSTYVTLKNTSATADKIAVWQPMESWISQQLSNAGQTVTITVWAKISSGTPKLKLGLLEWAGTADGINLQSGNIYSSWSTTTGTDPTWNTNYALNATTANITLSTSYQKLTLTVTVDASKNNLLPIVWLDSTAAQNVVLTLADYSFIPTAPVTVDDPTFLSTERFYGKTYDNDTVPGTNDFTGSVQAVTDSANLNQVAGQAFKATMRTDPTMTIYSIAGTTSKVSTAGGVDAGSGLVGNSIGQRGFRAVANGSMNVLSANTTYCYHYALDARL